MSRYTKTLQALSRPYTGGDLWDELNRDLKPLGSLLNFPNDQEFRVRFLGPFLHVRRLYIPRTNLLAKYNFDLSTIDKIELSTIKKINEQISYSNGSNGKKIQAYGDNYVGRWQRSHPAVPDIDRFKQFLDKLVEGRGWQRCIMVNSFLQDTSDNINRLKIAILNVTLCNSIVNQTNGNPDIKISGLNAHDVFITRRGMALNTNFEVKLSKKPNFLSEKDTEYIFSRGLLDIPSVIEGLPIREGGYLYRIKSDYQMPSKFNDVLFKEMAAKEEDRQLIDVEKHIDDMPRSAFENFNKMSGSINSLEIE